MKIRLKTLGLAFLTSVSFAGSGFAFKPAPRDFGVGLVLGSPTGLSAKYWLNDRNAFDAAIGFGDLTVQADYLWHSWTIFPQPPSGKVAGYMGLGAQLEFDDEGDYRHDEDYRHHYNRTSAGIRIPFGATYFFPRTPLELFLELVPVLEFTDRADLQLDAGLGGRFYFGRASDKR